MESSPPHPARVLLIEDDCDVATVLERRLPQSRHVDAVVHVTCLRDALAALRSDETFDAAVLDPGLPDAEGLEGLRALRSYSATLPIIVLTASNDESFGLESIRAGADDYRTKGALDPSEVARSIGYARERGAWREERARREEHERRTNRLLAAIAGVLGNSLRGADPGPELERVLSEILDLTGSEYGFIGEVCHDLDGTPYLKPHAVIDVSSDGSSRAALRERAPEDVRFRHLSTLFGAVLETGRPVIANDPATDPRSNGLPPGHSPLQAFLGLPFDSSGQLLGMVGIANRPGGYEEEQIAFLDPLIATCSTLIEAWRRERQRCEMERDLARARDEALESARLSSAILANMSHEIRTPLNVILGYATLLEGILGTREDSEVRDSLQSILRGGRRLMSLLQSILDLSRLEARTWSPDPRTLDLAPLVSSLVAEVRSLTSGRGIDLRLEPVDPRLRIRFDEHSLRQILGHLLRNAIKFTERGSVRIGAKRTAEGGIDVTVADTGVGIDSGFFPRLFEPFAQEELGYTRRFEGAGLGLALVERHAELNGASIEVTSEKCRGSVFKLRIPRSAVVSAPAPSAGGLLEGARPGR